MLIRFLIVAAAHAAHASYVAPVRRATGAPPRAGAIVCRKKSSWAQRVPASVPLGPGSVLAAQDGSYGAWPAARARGRGLVFFANAIAI